MIPDDHKEDITVPLVIYIGDERRVVGNAVITGEEVRCFVHASRGKDILEWMKGTATNLTVVVNPPPATPFILEGHVKWVTDYREGPTDNDRQQYSQGQHGPD